MSSKIKTVIGTFLKLAIAGGLLFYLFSSGKISVENLKALLSFPIVAGGLVLTGLVFFLGSERWRLLLHQQGFCPPHRYAFQLTLIGNFFNFFVPGGVGGDVIKAVLVAQHNPERKGKAILTVLADRILGLFTMVTLGLLAFAFEPGLLIHEKSFQLIFLILSCLFVGFILSFWLVLTEKQTPLHLLITKINQRVPRLGRAWNYAQSYRLSKTQMIRFMSLSLTGQLCSVLLFYLVAYVILPEAPPVSVFVFAVPVGFMVTAIPLAPAGVGIGQAAFLYLFSKALGHESNIGAMGITAFQALQLFYGIPGALIFVLLKKKDSSLSIESLNLESQT